MVEAASQKTGPRFKVSHDRFGERGIKLWVPRYIHYTTTKPFDLNTGILQKILSVFKLFKVSPFFLKDLKYFILNFTGHHCEMIANMMTRKCHNHETQAFIQVLYLRIILIENDIMLYTNVYTGLYSNWGTFKSIQVYPPLKAQITPWRITYPYKD